MDNVSRILGLADDYVASITWHPATTEPHNQMVDLVRTDADTRTPQAMLAAQARDLDMIFTGLAKRAVQMTEPHMADLLLRLALKAQAQCANTLRAIGELKASRCITLEQPNDEPQD